MLLTYSRFGVLLWNPLQNPGGLAIEGSAGLQVSGETVPAGWHTIDGGVFTFGYPDLQLGGWGDASEPELAIYATGLIDPSGLDTFWIPEGPKEPALPSDISRWRWTDSVRAEYHQGGELQPGLASCLIDNSTSVMMVGHAAPSGKLRELSFLGEPLPGRIPIKMPGQTLEFLQQYSQKTIARDTRLQKLLGCPGSGGRRL